MILPDLSRRPVLLLHRHVHLVPELLVAAPDDDGVGAIPDRAVARPAVGQIVTEALHHVEEPVKLGQPFELQQLSYKSCGKIPAGCS